MTALAVEILPAGHYLQQDPLNLAIAGFLARYGEPTRTGYALDLRKYVEWCNTTGLHPFDMKRPHLEVWARGMEVIYARATVKKRIATVCGFYKFAVIDGFMDKDPALHVRRPKLSGESTTNGLDRMELGAFLTQALLAGPRDHALACLLGMCGLRISEALGIDIEDLGRTDGHRTARIMGKGHKLAIIPLAPRTSRAVDLVTQERTEGPVLLNRAGDDRMDRFAAARIVKRLAKAAGIDKRISPHSLRHAYITNCLAANVSLRDVQLAARHVDPRTTVFYDRARLNLDRHASYVLQAFVAGSA